MKKTKKDRQNERGSALLLVLGILSLVLILGMSFVFTARTERQVAQANSSQMSAKLIAQSALNRVISDMGYYFRDDDDKPLVYPSVELTDDAEPITFGLQAAPGSDKGMQLCAVSKNLHIGSIDGDEQDHFNDLLHLDTFDPANDVYYESLPQVTIIDKVSGKETFTQPITVTYEDADGKKCTDVIGRYGYIILEEGSKIDVNSALSFSGKVPFAPVEATIYNNLEIKDIVDNFSRIASPYDEVADTYHETNSEDYVYYFTRDEEKDVTNGSSVEGENTVRLGLSMEEIQLKKKFWDKLPDGSSRVKKAPWMSYAHLANALGKEDFTEESFNYTFFSGEDIEAFWDADEKKERNRFDLTGFTASEKTGDGVKYKERMDENFWELTDDEKNNDKLQESAKKKMDQLTGASGSYKRAEFWKELTDGDIAVYFDGKKKGFWYKMKGDGTVDMIPEEDDKEYGGIPWLDKMKDDNDKSVSDQVAANLIDYSDKDDIASTDFKLELGSDGFWAEPTYCGNERVPYINEIDLKVEMTRDTDITPTGDTYSFKMNMKAMVELVNIYCNDNGTGDCEAVPDDLHVQLRVIGEFTVTEVKYVLELDPVSGQTVLKEKDGGRTTKTYPMGGDDGYVALVSSTEIPQFHLGYQVMELNGLVFPKEGQTDTDFPQPVNLQAAGVDEVKYYFSYTISQIIAIVYKDTVKNDNLCDVVFFPQETYYELSDTDPYSPTTTSFTGPYIVTMQANDPRCNMIAKRKDATSWDEELWKIEKYDADAGTEPENTLGDDEKGRDNSNFKTEVDKLKNKLDDKDWEHDVTFEASNTRSFSTAFIRNAPMQSLWELGAIHRGAPYQTINLKKFNTDATPNGKYVGGDAAILDYVKIGPLRFAKGRVNANTRNLGAIDLLLKDIDKETYDGDPLPSASTDTVKWKLTIDENDLMDLDKYPTSFNRGVMANLLFDMLDSDVKTDRDAEALIGKTAGLLTTRLDTYSVYIVAEALREMRELDDTSYPDVKDTLINPVEVKHYIRADEDYNSSTSSYRPAGTKTSYCSIVGTQRMLVQLVRDAWRNEIKVERVQYLEK
ncbi:MAG: hypothetical protein IKP58_18365 [Victivallales bacterium]|nr:hypothetical protein [Victivallales bacterium]